MRDLKTGKAGFNNGCKPERSEPKQVGLNAAVVSRKDDHPPKLDKKKVIDGFFARATRFILEIKPTGGRYYGVYRIEKVAANQWRVYDCLDQRYLFFDQKKGRHKNFGDPLEAYVALMEIKTLKKP